MTGTRQRRDELGGAHYSAEAFDDGSLNGSRCRATITQCDQVDVFGQPQVRKMCPSQGRTPKKTTSSATDTASAPSTWEMTWSRRTCDSATPNFCAELIASSSSNMPESSFLRCVRQWGHDVPSLAFSTFLTSSFTRGAVETRSSNS